MTLQDLTSVGRGIDFEVPTNRAIVILTLIVTLGGALWKGLSGLPVLASLRWGIQAGLTTFLTWALCRELDPDHPMAAFVAVTLVLPALYAWDTPRLSVVLWLLVTARVVNRTVGLPAGVLDAVGLLGLVGWLSLDGNWGYAAITALAFFLDSRLPYPARCQLFFALLAAAVAGITALLGGPMGQGAPSLKGGLIGLGLSLLFFLPVLLTASPVESVGDQTGEPLSPIRVRAAQTLALLAGVEAAFLGGIPALHAFSPLWAAALGAILTWLYRTLRS